MIHVLLGTHLKHLCLKVAIKSSMFLTYLSRQLPGGITECKHVPATPINNFRCETGRLRGPHVIRLPVSSCRAVKFSCHPRCITGELDNDNQMVVLFFSGGTTEEIVRDVLKNMTVIGLENTTFPKFRPTADPSKFINVPYLETSHLKTIVIDHT